MPLFGSSGHQGSVLNHQGDAAVFHDIFKASEKMIALLIVTFAAHAAADAFHPWGLNDSKAFVFPRIAEKRNRARRERLAATLRNDADARAAVVAVMTWGRTRSKFRDTMLDSERARRRGCGGKGVSVMSVSATGSYGSDGSSSAEELEIELQTRAAASKQNEERTDRGGAQEVLPDGSGGARGREAH